MLSDVEIITSIRSIRRIVNTLDSLGFPVNDIIKDEEMAEEIPADMPDKIVNLASEIHTMLQNVENSKRYKDAVRRICDIKERP